MAAGWLELHGWRTRMAAIYRERDAAVLAGEPQSDSRDRLVQAKNTLFTTHPQSPLPEEQRSTFAGLPYFPYDPAYNVVAEVSPITDDPSAEELANGTLRRAATLHMQIAQLPITLTMYWIDVYGGGLFLPFRDATGGIDTYGGGRYLFDTVKGSTFPELQHDPSGFLPTRIGLDFNYAYHPSCFYDVRWVCPLALKENWLTIPITAGERGEIH